MTEATHAIFLSYASQDAEAAGRICAALRAAGHEVWFDQSELRGGDAWDAKIRKQIKACALFVPIVSANTSHRTEGYFRLEWKLAVDRSHLMADERAFLVPVVVDDTNETDAIVPERFREVQWTRLPHGHATAAFVEQVGRLLSGDAPSARHTAHVQETSAVPRRAAAVRANATETSGPPARSRLNITLAMTFVAFATAIFVVYLVVGRVALQKKHGESVEATTTTPRPPSTPAVPSPTAPTDKSIAVLPFVDLSRDATQQYLGDGVSEEILSALSKLPGLRVVGRASSFRFRERDLDAVKVGHELGVQTLLAGTVQREGEAMRITVELIETATGVQQWSQRYDRKFKNLFALEDDIADAVSKALAVELGQAASGQQLVATATTNPRAHELYLRAKELFYRSDGESMERAVALFNQAIAEDPDYAAAWAGLATTYVFLADAYRAPVELLPSMKGAAEKAVALQPGLAEAHGDLGYILLAYERNFAAGKAEVERAVALNPGNADVHFFLGNYWLLSRNAAAAREQFLQGEKLDPLNPWFPYTQIWTATALGDYEAALSWAKRVLELDPHFVYFTDPLVYVYGSFGRWKECIARAEELQKQAPANADPDFMVAVCHARSGDTERARKMLAQLEAASLHHYVDHANLAQLYVALGDTTGAFAALDQAYRDRSAPLLNMWFLPVLKPLHDDPRYRKLMANVYAGLDQASR